MFTKQSIKSSVPVITLVIGILFFTYGTFGHFEEPSKIKFILPELALHSWPVASLLYY